MDTNRISLNINAQHFIPRVPFGVRPHARNQVRIPYSNIQHDNYIFPVISNENPSEYKGKSQENSIDPKSLEYLLSTPQITNSDDELQKENKTYLNLIDFQKGNLDDLKEDLIYYFSSPESLKHFKSSLDEEIKYEFYKDLECENFISAQKERFKQILSIKKSDMDSKMKISKLSNFNNNFCYKASLIQGKEQISRKLINANLIGTKMDESFFLYSKQEINENKIITYLNELRDIFTISNIDMESLGLIHFNFIEKNLISILKVMEIKLSSKKSINNLTNFCKICIDILKYFKSTKLYFYIIQFLKEYKELLDYTQLNVNKEMIQFIPNNCFDFNQLNVNNKDILISDLTQTLINKGFI